MSSEPGSWVDDWLSPGRFGVYVVAGGGDRSRALRLIRVERHHIRGVPTRSRPPGGRAHWTLDPCRLFPVKHRTAQNGTRIDANKTPREQIARAVDEAGPGTPSGKVIAELMFGFWRYLSTAAHDAKLWVPMLHKGFVPGTGRRAVDQPVGRLHKLRNRVAHHEPLLRQNLTDRHEDVLFVGGLISADLRDNLAAHTDCPTLIAARP